MFAKDFIHGQTELARITEAELDETTQGIIVSGCNITGTAGSYSISAGIVYLNGKYIDFTGATSPTLPVYLIEGTPQIETGIFRDNSIREKYATDTLTVVNTAPSSVRFVTIALNSKYRVWNYFYDRLGLGTVIQGINTSLTTITTQIADIYTKLGDKSITGEIKMFAGSQLQFFNAQGVGTGAWAGRAWADGRNGTMNMTARFAVSYDPSKATSPQDATGTIGNFGGLDFVTLNVDQIPSHTHQYNDIFHSEAGGAVVVPGNAGSGQTDSDNRGLQLSRTTATAGGNGQHENRPSYIVVGYAQKL